jgi:putative endonuclease
VAADASPSPRPDPRRALGAAGEAAVARWYERAGYRILDRNWRCREGELDLVVARADAVIFCEVKTRSSTAFGSPVEAITATKRRRLRVLAGRWLEEHEVGARDVRVDVAAVMRTPNGELTIEMYEGIG